MSLTSPIASKTAQHNAFDQWLAKEKSKGLVDCRISVTNQRGITPGRIRDELLNLEALIENGRIKELPKPKTFLPQNIESIIRSVSI